MNKQLWIFLIITIILLAMNIWVIAGYLPKLWQTHNWQWLITVMVIIWGNGIALSVLLRDHLTMPVLRDIVLTYSENTGFIPGYLEDFWNLFIPYQRHLLFGWGFAISQWILVSYLLIFEETNMRIVTQLYQKQQQKERERQ